MKKAYGYLRVSTKSQVDGDGFDRQESEIRNYAKAAGVKIVEVYREEGISGTTDESARPAFQDMMAAILKNGIRTIIIEGLDRLAREYRVQESFLLYLASKGIELISARTDENVTESVLSDPMKKALIQIQGVFSELEKNCIVKKLKAARIRKKESTGKCEGRKGYTENPLVYEEIRKLKRKKKGMKSLPFAAIAAILNERGLKTMDGKRFTGVNVSTIWYRHHG